MENLLFMILFLVLGIIGLIIQIKYPVKKENDYTLINIKGWLFIAICTVLAIISLIKIFISM